MSTATIERLFNTSKRANYETGLEEYLLNIPKNKRSKEEQDLLTLYQATVGNEDGDITPEELAEECVRLKTDVSNLIIAMEFYERFSLETGGDGTTLPGNTQDAENAAGGDNKPSPDQKKDAKSVGERLKKFGEMILNALKAILNWFVGLAVKIKNFFIGKEKYMAQKKVQINNLKQTSGVRVDPSKVIAKIRPLNGDVGPNIKKMIDLIGSSNDQLVKLAQTVSGVSQNVSNENVMKLQEEIGQMKTLFEQNLDSKGIKSALFANRSPEETPLANYGGGEKMIENYQYFFKFTKRLQELSDKAAKDAKNYHSFVSGIVGKVASKVSAGFADKVAGENSVNLKETWTMYMKCMKETSVLFTKYGQYTAALMTEVGNIIGDVDKFMGAVIKYIQTNQQQAQQAANQQQPQQQVTQPQQIQQAAPPQR